MNQKQKLRGNFTNWQKSHENSEGDPLDTSTQAIPLDEGRETESRYIESSNRWLSRDETHGVEVHEVSTDAEDASTISHKDEVDESKTMWYFDTASNSHVTANRAHFLTFSKVDTQLPSIRGVEPNIVSRIAGKGTVGFVTEVAGKTLAFFRQCLVYPRRRSGLFYPGLTVCQGFSFKFDETSQVFSV